MQIGFIGLGIMGEPMAANIINKRKSSADEFMVYDLDPAKVAATEALGAKGARSVAEIGAWADVVITMVPTSDNVRSVFNELLPTVRAGQLLVDMSTIDPAVSRELAAAVEKKGGKMLDAPVVKSKPAAIDGTLGIYVGGDAEALSTVKDLLLCMGSALIHLGPNGAGLIMKACHNQLVAQIQNGVNEMITLADNYGISVDDFVTAISYGGGQNFYLDVKAAAIRDRNFATAFSVRNMHKDVGIASRLAAEKRLQLPGLGVVGQVYQNAIDAGLGDDDFSATFQVVRDAEAGQAKV